ncbi:HEAT repeat domain-containing protein [Planctomycetota bacterium]
MRRIGFWICLLMFVGFCVGGGLLLAEESTAELLRKMENPDPKVNNPAGKELIKRGKRTVVKMLIPLLVHEHNNVRSNAWGVIYKLANENTSKMLYPYVDCKKYESYVYRKTAILIARIDGPGAVPELIKRLKQKAKDPDERERRGFYATFHTIALNFSRDGDYDADAYKPLLEIAEMGLKDEHDMVRFNALTIISSSGADAIMQYAPALLKDKKPKMRLQMMRIISKIKSVDEIKRFIPMTLPLVCYPDINMRKSAYDVIKKGGSLELSESLLEFLDGMTITDGKQLSQLSSLIGSFTDKTAIDELERMFVEHSNPAVRGIAQSHLKYVVDASYQDRVRELLQHKSAAVRLGSIDIAWRCGARAMADLAPMLVGMLKDKDKGVRSEVFDTLERFFGADRPKKQDWKKVADNWHLAHGSKAPGSQSENENFRKLWDPVDKVRWKAVEALTTTSDQEIIEELLWLLAHDHNSIVNDKAAETLAAIGDRSIVPQLLKILAFSESYSTGGFFAVPKDSAAMAIQELGDLGCIYYLVLLLDNRNSGPRDRGLEAIEKLCELEFEDVAAVKAWWAKNKKDPKYKKKRIPK